MSKIACLFFCVKKSKRERIKSQLGFTLIELLVVISIIGLLASVVLVSLNSVRGKARDAKRLADKNQMILALNLFYDSNNGRWPETANSGTNYSCLAPTGEWCWGGITGYEGLNSLVSDLQPYIASFPKNNADPGSIAYDRMMFITYLTSPGWTSGAYLVWVQENSIPASSCPNPTILPQHYDKYYYCFEYLGI